MIPFSPPNIDQKIIDEVTEVLRSGWITTGPRTKEFERQLATYNGVPNVLCVNSATAGLELMLRWFGVGEADEVIVPAYTYCATANVVLHTGAKPILVDVGDEFNIDIARSRSAITVRTKAIMPVDVGGWPCRYDEITALVEDARGSFDPNTLEQEQLGRILVHADAAHSLGARYKGVKSASLADCSICSFHAVKNLTTAEGGSICLNFPEPFDNESLYEALCVASLHGQSKDALAKSDGSSWEYDVAEAGYKSNMNDIAAAMGLVQLARYESETLPRRKRIFEQYSKGLGQYEWAQLPDMENSNSTSSFHVYLLRIRDIDEKERNRIIERIFEQGVSVNVHFKPLPLLSLYRKLGYEAEDYPVALDNYIREISLPVYCDLSDDQVAKVIEAVVQAVESQL